MNWMDSSEKLKIIEEMQEVVLQMKLDDIEENPDSEFEYFTCPACGKSAPLAGSITYEDQRVCNDCVLLVEVGLKLNELKNISDFIEKMEDKRLEELCDYIKVDESAHKN